MVLRVPERCLCGEHGAPASVRSRPSDLQPLRTMSCITGSVKATRAQVQSVLKDARAVRRSWCYLCARTISTVVASGVVAQEGPPV
jgi:hypothetical protein